MIISSQLEEFGLNNKEAKIYLASLKLGPDTVQSIAKQSNIHRVTVYDILESLIKKGLMIQVIKDKKRYFIGTNPEKILHSLKDRQRLFNSLLPELKAIQNKGSEKPKVMYFEGREGVWKAFLDRIKHKSELKENLVYGSSERLLTTYPEEYKKFLQERIKKDIRTKIIIEKSRFGLKEYERADEELREVKFLPRGKKFQTNTMIYGDRILIISWESMLAVIIEDKDNAENQRLVFNLLWEYLP